jgi:Ser/Thr protein kinase RdoA (MazF antagonist)
LHTLSIGFKPVYAHVRASYDPHYALACAATHARLMDPAVAAPRQEWLRTELAQIALPTTVPKGAIHGDLNPSNFLFRKGRLTAVLDFDQSSYTYLLHDVAQLVYWWAWADPDRLDWNRASQLLEAYEMKRELSEDEKERLYDMLLMINLIAMGWDVATNDFLESQRRVRHLRSVGRAECRARLFGR